MRDSRMAIAALVVLASACSDATQPSSTPSTVPISALVTTQAALQPAVNECSTRQTGWIWCDDFEQNRLSSYFEVDDASGRFHSQTGTGIGSSTSMVASYVPGQQNSGSLKLAFGRTPSSYFRPVDAGTANYRELYWRMYVKNESGWTGGGGGKLSRATIFTNSNWAQAMIAHVWTPGESSGETALLLDPASGTNSAGQVKTTGYNDFANLTWLGAQQSSVPMFTASTVAQWYCVESHVKLNDAGQSNGIFELWINGQSAARETALNWVGSYNAYGLNALLVENYWNNTAPKSELRYLDNLVVSTQPIGCGSSSPTPPTNAPVALVSVNPTSGQLAVGATAQLAATEKDASGNLLSGRSVTWTSSNSGVASVSGDGLVTANAAGTATITATSEGVSGTAAVTVASSVVPVYKVAVSPTKASLVVGQTLQLGATPKDASSKPLTGRVVTWSSANPAVVTISSTGLLTAISAGKSRITARSENGTGWSNITVTGGSSTGTVAKVALTPTSASPTVGQTVQLAATVKDASGNALSGQTVTWTSSNSGVASVSSSGLVSAKAAGSATITATSSGITGLATITVKTGTSTPVVSVSVSPSNAQPMVGQTVQLVATDKNASGAVVSGEPVAWSSSNSAAAAVSSNGMVTAKAAGSAMITASSDGMQGTASITVQSAPSGGGGGGSGSAPTPSGTIVFDTRAGGAQSLQSAQTVSQAMALFPGNTIGSPAFTTNLDGNGTHAMRFDWTGRPAGSSEEQVTVERPMNVSGRVVTSWKEWLGRTATGGGNGAIGAFALQNGQSNAHQKNILWVRSNGNRIYFAWRPGYTIFSIDNNNWNSNPFSPDPLTLKAQVQQWTVDFTPSSGSGRADGIMRVWLNGTKVLDQTNADLGTDALTSLQFPATTLVPAVDMSQYYWDIVVWKP